MEGGLSRWRVPPCRVSHPIQKISDGLIIIGLGLKGPASDGPRVGCILASDRDHTAVCLIVSHLHEGGDVGVGVEHGLVRLVCSQYRPWRGVWSDGVCQLVDCHRNFLSNPRHTMRRASRTMKPDIVMLSKVQKRGGISPLSSDAFQRRKE